MSIRTNCARCPKTAVYGTFKGQLIPSAGWVTLTVAGAGVRSMLLCGTCAGAHRAFLATPPEQAEQERENAIQAAFTRGYEDGRTDAQAATARTEAVDA